MLDRCSKTIAPLKPTKPPVTIALPSASLPPRPYKRHRRHTHQSPPLFYALAPLIYAHIASPSSFNHRHRSSLVAGKILSLRRRFLPMVRFAPPPLHFGAITSSPHGRSRLRAWASVSVPLDLGHGPWWTGWSSGPRDRGLGSRIFSKKMNSLSCKSCEICKQPPWDLYYFYSSPHFCMNTETTMLFFILALSNFLKLCIGPYSSLFES
jgi:hypothetical protein